MNTSLLLKKFFRTNAMATTMRLSPKWLRTSLFVGDRNQKYEFVEFVSSLAAILYVVNTKASRQ